MKREPRIKDPSSKIRNKRSINKHPIVLRCERCQKTFTRRGGPKIYCGLRSKKGTCAYQIRLVNGWQSEKERRKVPEYLERKRTYLKLYMRIQRLTS